ncbi:PAS-domain containing protein [Pseudooceanicola sp. MF1-13]|uniref:PAS-domain containing protein n=1 Tax=Pseudooceanicola sp. MF1-13 TaxID=3379095 RepID=UPI0038920E31
MDFKAHDSLTRAGLNLIQQALSIYDEDLRLVLSNQQFQSMFSLPAKLTKTGASFEDSIRHLIECGEYGPVDDVEAAIRERVDQARTFQPHYFERTRANGRVISVEGAPLPQGGWVTVYTDITDIKRQENLLRARSEELSGQLLNHAEDLAATNRKLQATNAALEEARRELTRMEARTRMTTEMMPAHIAHLESNLTYSYSNRRLSSVMPGRPSNILGLHMADVLGAQAYMAVKPYVEQAFDGRSSVFEFTDEASSRRIRTALTPDGAGGAYILSMDITEESQTRAALAQSRRRQLAAQVTSGMAHDFSNLLTIILGTQSRLAAMNTDPEAQKLIDATVAAAHRGGDLLNGLAKMTADRTPAPAPVDLGAFLDELATLAGPTLGDRARLTINDQTDGARLMLDVSMLQDSLLNLILNAKDAVASQDRDHGQITLTARNIQDTWLDLTVADDGTGFSAAALEHALDPFFTTKGDNGTGLGLSTVYDMTQLVGGRMKIGNGKVGGWVSLMLPWRRAQAASSPGLALLVEDSPDLRQNVRAMLRADGYSVIEAASVDEARSLVTQVPGLTLVLTDISLEGHLTGIDLFDSLPDDAPPCYMMTSLRPDHPLHVSAAQRTPVLRKPFKPSDLSYLLGHGVLPE